MYCTWLAEIQDAKKLPKIAIYVPSDKFVGLYLRNYGTYRQLEKIVKQQYLPHMSTQYGELRPANGWNLLAILGNPSKFQRVSRLGFVTAPTSLNGGQPNFTRCLHDRLLGWYIIYFLRVLAPLLILPGAIFTLRPSLALSYIGSVTACYSSSERQLNFTALYKEWN